MIKVFQTFPAHLRVIYFLVAAIAPLGAATTADIQVDQTGYLTTETKLAMVTNASAAGPFTVLTFPGGVTVFSGSLGPSSADANSGITIRTADFSAVTAPGTYLVSAVGLGQSYPFAIGPNVYAGAFYDVIKFFYGQRCGMGVTLTKGATTWSHGPCHLADGTFDPSSGKTGFKNAAKGWHDAGDYGKYVVNSGISTAELLWTYEWYSNRIGKLNLHLPESGNSTPDILNECRWNLEWMLAMQDSDGGVWPKLTTAKFDRFEMPEVDSAGPRLIIGSGSSPYKTTAATADFAAVMAIATRLYQPYDAAFSRACLEAAVRAWGWAQTNPLAGFDRNPAGISTGEYSDHGFRENFKKDNQRLWAAAELYRTTGDEVYSDFFNASYKEWNPTVSGDAYPQDWADPHDLAMWTYYFSKRSTADAKALAIIKADTLAAADKVVARQKADGYRVSLRAKDYIWGSNGGVANYGILLLMANAMTPDADYVQAVLDDIHYLLGRNANKISYVTGLGTSFVMHPHHRPSAADGILLAWPGMLSGGPNVGGQDHITPTGLPPARCYTDTQGAYASNEVAINWNAPLVFILANTLPDPGPKDKSDLSLIKESFDGFEKRKAFSLTDNHP